MIGDGSSRGTVLETLIIKTKLAMAKHGFNIRIIGMSATLSNLDDFGKFLNADVYEKNYRPLALKEYVKCGSKIYEFIPEEEEPFKFHREINDDSIPEDPENLRILIKEILPHNSCLVFCPTKRHCENVTLMLCKFFDEMLPHKKCEKLALINQFIQINNGTMCKILKRSIPYGVVYHHSGLTAEERELIETAFLSGTLSCIVCTSTLAAGVNLPAQRVIIREPYIGRSFISVSSYKQMSGRAGRAGFGSEVGESILITSERDINSVKQLFIAPIMQCLSSLRLGGNGLSTLILSLFYLGFSTSLEDIKKIILNESLYGVQFHKKDEFFNVIYDSFSKLCDLKLISKFDNDSPFVVTPLGVGVVKGLINVDKCTRIYDQISQNLTSFNLSTDLHLIYLSTLPFDEDDFGISVDPAKFFDSYLALNDEEHKAATVIGIKPGAVTRFRQNGIVNEKLKRFYVTMIVYDVKKRITDLSVLSEKYDLQSGTLQLLLSQLATNASSLHRFVAEIKKFEKLESILENFSKTLFYCCTPELIPLLELPAVKIARAKQLYSAGFKTITDIAKASTNDLVRSVDKMSKKQAQEIIQKAKNFLLASADELVEEANELAMAVVLMIAEKPSLAESLAKILSNGHVKTRKGSNGACFIHEYRGAFNGISNCLFKFTSVCGHVMTSDFPGKYNNWDRVEPLELFSAPVIKKEANPNLHMPKFLQGEARNADYLVLWLDCDKEGENICFEVIDCVKTSMRISFYNPQTVFRARFSAITEKDVKNAMRSLVSPNKLEALSVDARQEADLRVGCAFTRFQTKYFHGKYGDLDSALISYGPCQTPTLGFCVDRHDKIQSFQPQPYWVLQVSLQGKSGPTINVDWEREREFNQSTAKSYLRRVKSQKKAIVISVSKKVKSKTRPQALNTVELLRVASAGLGIGPHHAMQLAEKLYTQGYISYPRTETTHYPANFDLIGTLNLQKSHPDYSTVVQKLISQKLNKPRSGHDAGDHPPITPMRTATQNDFSDRDSWRVYDYIVRHFIGTLSKDLIYEQTTINFLIGEEKFSKSGCHTLDPGFTEIMPWLSLPNDQRIDTDIKIGDEYFIVDVKLIERMTSPPDYLSEADLIALMEKHGIGTDASIPTHINNICLRNYVKVASGRRLIPTQLGIVLVHGYQKIDSELVESTTRSEVEKQLNEISIGKADYETVLKRTLLNFKNKFETFMANIGAMDELFEVSFSSLADSGKPLSRCGNCRRYLKLIAAKPARLYCNVCNQTLSVPQNGSYRQYKEVSCPLDNFELLYFTGNNKSFVFCPNCYNNPPFEEMKKLSGCNSCPNENCPQSMVFHEISTCSECSFNGKLVLDPGSGPPEWRIACNKCDFWYKSFKEAIKVNVENDNCGRCESKLIMIEYKKEHNPSELRGCMFCDESLSRLIFAKNPKNLRGRGRDHSSARGGYKRNMGGDIQTIDDFTDSSIRKER
ncbi:DNA topoisomerase 3-beta-1-like protein [Dinothrombium tinctorium]|nr:DNA topoisomerase 3-beta-1-like protein [Dinothrombium tinctorium]RWS16850.1 DNA topoisomerase 3-beta-1-like protein [Dinothrombium tinctorium]